MDSSLLNLCQKIKEREQRVPLAFKEFMDLSAREPGLVFRNIFQIFYDMIYSYIGDGADEYPDDPESINFVYYDCSRLFVEETDHPFFADMLFANRLINHISSFRRGIRQNRIYIFEGPHGCGKSTFLNNLLMKFEQYTKSPGGVSYETVWRLDRKELGSSSDHEAHHILTQLRGLTENSAFVPEANQTDNSFFGANKDYLEVPCPSHDNPLLLIPKTYRREFFDNLIQDKDFKSKLFSEKQYEWVFKDSPCTICMSLYQTLLDMFDSPSKVFDMVFARRYLFNRRLGQGISVFNPGDGITKTSVMTNQLLQSQLNSLLRDSNRVRYLFSRYANTNNGIYALMDIKAHNKERLANLHGIISEGVHKVEDIEENVNSLFFALMNPEDQENIAEIRSFSDRITYIKIPYILDYNTEVKIYKNVFGDQIESSFLPGILENFARVIISSRLNRTSKGLDEWISDPDRYRLYCDRNLLLLKMDIYIGRIPSWLREEDKKKFNARRRGQIIAESEIEGDRGITGRDSIKIFSDFYSKCVKRERLINMAAVYNFFKKHCSEVSKVIPDDFLDSLVSLYNYNIFLEISDALNYPNEDHISQEIQNYLFAIKFKVGKTETCPYTGDELEITEHCFEDFERKIQISGSTELQRRSFREDVLKRYKSESHRNEMLADRKPLTETELYKSLYHQYIHNLKNNGLDLLLENNEFRTAITHYATEAFKSSNKRIRRDVSLLIQSLKTKYGYTELSAKEVIIYVIDNNLAKAFKRSS